MADSNNIQTILEETKKAYLEVVPEFLQRHKLQVANPEEIQTFEKKVGSTLPEDFKMFLLNCDFELQINANFSTLSFEAIKTEWESWAKSEEEGVFNGRLGEPDGGDNFGMQQKIIKQNWWDKKWIPFASDGCGNVICIDLDPAENGVIGQIVQMETASGPYFEGSKSITEFCAKQLDLIKNNKYTVEDGSFYIDGDM